MGFFQREPPRKDAGPVGPAGRWFQAVTGHFCFVALVHLLLCLSLVPALLCAAAFLATGGAVFLPAAAACGAAAGPVAAAVQRAAWELQFGHPNYLYRSFFGWVRGNLRQGLALGAILGGLWCLLLSPLALLALGGTALPAWLWLTLAAGAAVLAAAGNYALYQAARWDLPLGALLKNSLLLLFAAGWRTLVTAAIGLLAPAGLLLCYPAAFPLYVVTGLPVLLCVTAQAFFAPRVDALLGR